MAAQGLGRMIVKRKEKANDFIILSTKLFNIYTVEIS